MWTRELKLSKDACHSSRQSQGLDQGWEPLAELVGTHYLRAPQPAPLSGLSPGPQHEEQTSFRDPRQTLEEASPPCLAQDTQQLGTSACTRCFLLESLFPVPAATTCQHAARELTFPQLAPGRRQLLCLAEASSGSRDGPYGKSTWRGG